MVRNKVHDYTQSGFMRTLHQRHKLLHTLTLILGDVRLYVIVVGDGVRTAGLALGDSRIVALGGSITDDTRVPHMRSA